MQCYLELVEEYSPGAGEDLRIEICGFYGFGNMGDEAVLQAIMQELGDNEYIISTSLPLHLFERYSKIIGKELRLHEDMRTDFDAYILGGGELNWGYGWRQCLSIFSRNVPCMNYGVSYNKRYFYSEKLHSLYYEFLKNFDAITVRDEFSLQLLEKIGLEPVLTFDPAINLKTVPFDCPENKIAVFPRYADYPISNRPQMDWLIQELKDVAEDVVLVPCAPFNNENIPVDLELCRYLHERLKGSQILSISPFEPGKFKHFISKSKMVYSGGRYHPLVFAIAHDTPYKIAPIANSYSKILSITDMHKKYGRKDLIKLSHLNNIIFHEEIIGFSHCITSAHQSSTYTEVNRYPEIFTFCSRYFEENKQLSILSFGCGTQECFDLVKYFPATVNIVGVDINDNVIKKCNHENKYSNVYFICNNTDTAYEEVKKRGPYDIILCMSVLCRYDNPDTDIYSFLKFQDAVEELDRILKIGGLLVIYNSNFRFSDTTIYHKYIVLNYSGQDSGFVQKFDAKNKPITTEEKYNECIFVKTG